MLTDDTQQGPPPDGPIVFFDGECGLCHRTVRFLVEHDPAVHLRFAPLQSDATRRLLAGYDTPALDDPDSVLLLDRGRLYERSTAVLKIARYLPMPWRALSLLRFIPRPVRDAVYRFIARHRLRWFGRHDSCQRPSAELRRRLID